MLHQYAFSFDCLCCDASVIRAKWFCELHAGGFTTRGFCHNLALNGFLHGLTTLRNSGLAALFNRQRTVFTRRTRAYRDTHHCVIVFFTILFVATHVLYARILTTSTLRPRLLGRLLRGTRTLTRKVCRDCLRLKTMSLRQRAKGTNTHTRIYRDFTTRLHLMNRRTICRVLCNGLLELNGDNGIRRLVNFRRRLMVATRLLRLRQHGTRANLHALFNWGFYGNRSSYSFQHFDSDTVVDALVSTKRAPLVHST